MKYAFYCTCGGKLTGSAPESDRARIETVWRVIHDRPECQDTDKQTCEAARMRHRKNFHHIAKSRASRHLKN